MSPNRASTDEGSGSKGQNVCRDCGKRIATAKQSGELAAHMFQDYYCSCKEKGRPRVSKPKSLLQKIGDLTSTVKVSTKSGAQDPSSISEFCPKCGLKISKPSLPGSLTGYLFQDVRCKCEPEADFTEGVMSVKLWNLKKAGLGKTFTNLGQGEKDNAVPTIDLAAGAIIGGVYRIIERIGSGGMGDVYLADHLGLGTQVALKLIPPEQVTEIGWRRFQQEARAIAKLDHINLVKVSDLGIHEGCLPFYAMEHVPGHSLAETVAQYGPMPLNTTIEIFSQICDGLDHAHRAGIIHRDIKPANIMVTETRGKLRVKILDFGLAKLAQQDRHHQSLTAIGDVFGSPLYMSPEQCDGEKTDNRSDIYSLGCTLFECLTGQPPFTGNLAAAIVIKHQEHEPPSLESIVGQKRLPQSMEVVIAKLLRKNPVERYQTLSELKGDLEKVGRGENVAPFYMSRSKGTADDASARPGMTNENATTSRKNNIRNGRSVSGQKVLIISAVSLALLAGLAATFHWIIEKPDKTTKTAASTSTSNSTSTPNSTSASTSASTPTARPSSGSSTDADESNERVITQKDMDSVDTNFGDMLGNNGADTSVPAVAPKSAAITTPFCQTLPAEKHKGRLFTFPVDITLGQVQSTSRPQAVIARGAFRFPAGDRITFVPFPAIAQYPSYLKRFRPGDISGIELPRYSDPNPVIRQLPNLPGFENLYVLAFSHTQKLDAESIQIVKRLTALKILDVNQEAVDADTVAQFPCLGGLNCLNLVHYDSASAILMKLRNSFNLQRITFEGCKVSKEDLVIVAAMPRLETLQLGDNLRTDEQVETISRSPCLAKLCIPHGWRPTYRAIKALKSMKCLKVIYLGTESQTPDNNMLTLKHALPNVHVYKIESTDPGVLPE